MKNSWLVLNELFISALLRKYTLGGGVSVAQVQEHHMAAE